MFRGTTVRSLVSLLAAVLLALPFLASSPSFAHVPTVRHTEADTRPGITSSGKPPQGETVTSRSCGRSGAPGDPLRTRDRHRATTAAGSTPQERVPAAQDPAPAHRPGGPAAPYHHSSRHVASHSPAALQVFRC
ncbi:hypothetical protein ACH4F6_17355 [Streptomyces sp. NPDC017936]|uniref:hypothetical protein n=1 Tax=Streptomyces sp. NPDC017936 TaxID=3365016 RepID=UPI0037A5BE8F